MNRGGAGARSLNIELQAALNPAGDRLARHGRLWAQDGLTYFRASTVDWPDEHHSVGLQANHTAKETE
jgi:hypothetical protein